MNGDSGNGLHVDRHHHHLHEDGDDDRRLLILYASQTGSAQDVAEYIGREAWRRHFKARVQDVREFEKEELLDSVPTIIVTSTTGQGHFPSSILPLWNFLIRADLPQDLLQDFHYAIFGLGDSSYAKFNWPARKIKRRLDMLGAQEMIEKGEGDDQHYQGVDGTLKPWLDNLWSTLLQLFPLPLGMSVIPPFARPPPRIALQPVPVASTSTGPSFIDVPGMLTGRLVQNDRITAPDHFQDTRHLIFEFDEDLDYEAGDILELRPQNLPEDVDKFLKRMKWDRDADEVYELESVIQEHPLSAHWQRRITLRQLFIHYLDVFSVPRRSFFEWLSYFTRSSLETEKLQEFCSSEGQEDMYDYANRTRRTIAEVLEEFRSANIPLEYVADIFPEIRPRQFSIASSAKVNPRRADLLVAIVTYRTKLQSPRKGVATSWLAKLQPGQLVSASVTAGTMRLPKDPLLPIVMVGPGTGIAPFRAFAQERAAYSRQDHAPETDTLVFFGCRSETKDCYFGQEWKQMENERHITFSLAASRDQADKIYVQHRIKERGEQVWRILGEGKGNIYVSGSANQMPKAVRKALKDIFVQHGSMTAEGADQYLEQMEADGRYQEETWS